jgi:hypothetical protein
MSKTLTRYKQGARYLGFGRIENDPMTPNDEGHLYAKDEVDAIIAAKDARIAELEEEIERLDVGGVHSCHQHCKRPGCVQRRQIEKLEPASKWFGEVMAMLHGDGGHYLAKHGPEKAALDAVARFRELDAERDAERNKP